MTDRTEIKADFLARAGLADAAREPLAGDASTRAYERLHRPGRPSLILMDQPPAAESTPCPPDATPDERRALGYNACARLAAGRVDAFVAAAGFLRSQGLSAPEVVAADPPAGLAVLEDLGDDLYARLIERGAAETPLYEAAVDLLADLHAVPPPARLEGGGATWPLLSYDALALETYGDLFLEWWPKHARRAPFSAEATAEWNALWTPIRARAEAGADAFVHRDYHAENLIWLPQRAGAARVGLLDFQDAVRASPAIDLLLLLQDARRDVSPALEAAMLARYLAARAGLDHEAFHADYHALGAFNAARILALFARQVEGFGRPRYTAFMPRTWRALERNLADPAMTPMAAWFARELPPETRP